MKMRVEFGDLKLDERVAKHFGEILKTNLVSGGPKVKEFEEKWGKLFDYKYNVAMSSGTSADIAACMTLYDFGAERGDEIIAPALAFAAVGNSIFAAGFKPVFVDIDRQTLNINPNLLEERITDKTKAIMAVHTMGKPCDMDSILKTGKKHHLKIIEDSCEAHGARYNGKFVGSFGDISTFSFYVAHILSCGDGGMVSTNNPEISDIIKSVKSHGRPPNSIYFDHVRYGLNFRMNDLVASVGLPQIEDFWKIFKTRKDNLYYLLEKTKDLEEFAYFNLEEKNEVVCPHAFSITLKEPGYDLKRLYAYLEDNSVKCKRNFGSMPTQHKAFAFLGHKLGEFPDAEFVGDNGLHFGIHQYLSKEDLDYVSDLLHSYFAKFGKHKALL
jgi:dTDP-4-amino-4,6-dideoxygalactose transaminase